MIIQNIKRYPGYVASYDTRSELTRQLQSAQLHMDQSNDFRQFWQEKCISYWWRTLKLLDFDAAFLKEPSLCRSGAGGAAGLSGGWGEHSVIVCWQSRGRRFSSLSCRHNSTCGKSSHNIHVTPHVNTMNTIILLLMTSNSHPYILP